MFWTCSGGVWACFGTTGPTTTFSTSCLVCEILRKREFRLGMEDTLRGRACSTSDRSTIVIGLQLGRRLRLGAKKALKRGSYLLPRRSRYLRQMNGTTRRSRSSSMSNLTSHLISTPTPSPPVSKTDLLLHAFYDLALGCRGDAVVRRISLCERTLPVSASRRTGAAAAPRAKARVYSRT
jgi:hypothetical protein